MRLNWLHITDLHMGLNDQDHLWPNIEQAFYNDLSGLTDKQGPIDLVFFTGDLVQSGGPDEFLRLSSLLNRLWAKLSATGSRPTLLVVPGNHDLQRPPSGRGKLTSPTLRILLRWFDFPDVHQDLFIPGNEYLPALAQIFSPFIKWCSDDLPKFQNSDLTEMKQGLLPGDFASTLTVRGIKIGVIGLNSAFLQLSDGDYTGRLAVYNQQLHALCPNPTEWECSHHVTFLLSHHPRAWLHPEIISRAWAEIAPAGRFDFHIFGHMHENKSSEESVDGGEIRRSWQGSSLFGVEHYISAQGKGTKREHGYRFGQINFENGVPSVRQFPRRAVFHEENGWRIDIDPRLSRPDSDGGSPPKPIKRREPHTPAASKRTTPVSTIPQHGKKAIPQSLESLLDGYREIVNRDHGFIRFVEVPRLQDMSDIEIFRLYVAPEVSAQQVYCDWPVNRWGERLDVFEMLLRFERVVLLGDPGYGKSTLVSYVSWLLCNTSKVLTPPSTDAPQNPHLHALLAALQGFVPIPLILREMQLQADLTWESLIESFVQTQALGRHLQTGETVKAILNGGHALVMLDGIDEISNATVRNRLKSAVLQGMAAYPRVRWLLTSRIVGYDEVPFDYTQESSRKRVVGRAGRSSERRSDTPPNSHITVTKVCERYYLAPFSNEKISAFSYSWFSTHESDPAKIKGAASEFFINVASNEGTKRLARIPFLLTLMSLLYHKNLGLPHGRAELYERIATAYLESIDAKRKLTHLPYSLIQKKQWLSLIGFQMQSRRAAKSSQFGASEILASERSVKQWLERALLDVGAQNPKVEAQHLLDYFAARSGLFLPRAHQKFAFAHLSLQEYFAACYLEPRLAASRFSELVETDPSDEELFAWVNKSQWRETFALLFEILAARGTKQTEAFLRFLFSDDRLGNSSPEQHVAVESLAEIVIDPFNSITAGTRADMKKRCWRWLFDNARPSFTWAGPEREVIDLAMASTARTLLSEHKSDLRMAWTSANVSRADLDKVVGLRFDACAGLSDLSPLTDVRKLQALSLERCGRISDISPLEKLSKLNSLNLLGCDAATDLSILTALPALETLFVSVGDARGALSVLQGFKSLKVLKLRSSTGAIDLDPLRKINSLTELILEEVSDLATVESLAALTDLQELHIHGCPLDADLAFLSKFKKLAYVCKAGSTRLKIPSRFDL